MQTDFNVTVTNVESIKKKTKFSVTIISMLILFILERKSYLIQSERQIVLKLLVLRKIFFQNKRVYSRR